MTSGSSDISVDYDRSRYPRHVPTIREQAEGSEWEPDSIETMADVRNMTAIGSLINPFTLRSHYERFYEADTVRDRMDNWSDDSGDGRPITTAHSRGPGASGTVYPKQSRRD